MNNAFPAERSVRLLVFALCALAYTGGLFVVFQWLESPPPARNVSVRAVKISFSQVELQAAPQPKPEPEFEPEPEPEMVPEEDVDVALEEVTEEPEPDPPPEPKPVVESEAPVANVAQDATAEILLADPPAVQGWVLEQIETEKYYPAVAERLGFKGVFNLMVAIGADGTIQSAKVLDGTGHRILFQALEKMLAKLPGRCFGQPIGEAVELEVEFEFE